MGLQQFRGRRSSPMCQRDWVIKHRLDFHDFAHGCSVDQGVSFWVMKETSFASPLLADFTG